MGGFELPYASRIPQFTGDSKILAAANHSVGFATFGGGGNALGREIVLFTTSDRDETMGHISFCNKLECGFCQEWFCWVVYMTYVTSSVFLLAGAENFGVTSA